MSLLVSGLKKQTPALEGNALLPRQAQRIAGKIEWHYTPEHGSWLNMAEIELSVLSRQCLKRRLPDQARFIQEVEAWEQARNAEQVTIDWQFKAEEARIKLKRLYPLLHKQSST